METRGYEYVVRATEQGIGTKQVYEVLVKPRVTRISRVTMVLQATGGWAGQRKEAETTGFPMVRPLPLASHNLPQIMNTWTRPLRRLVKTARQHYRGTCS